MEEDLQTTKDTTVNDISISTAKAIREKLGATHLVIYAIGEDGTSHVATHGKTLRHARQAAHMGNGIKEHLGWPKEMCEAEPVERICGNCTYWRVDSLQSDGVMGICSTEPKQVSTTRFRGCRHFEPDDQCIARHKRHVTEATRKKHENVSFDDDEWEDEEGDDLDDYHLRPH